LVAIVPWQLRASSEASAQTNQIKPLLDAHDGSGSRAGFSAGSNADAERAVSNYSSLPGSQPSRYRVGSDFGTCAYATSVSCVSSSTHAPWRRATSSTVYAP